MVTEASNMSPHRPPARPRVRPLRGAGGALAWTWRPGRWPSTRPVAEKMAPRLGSVSTVPCVAWDHYIWSRSAEPRRQMAGLPGAGAGPAAGRGLPLCPRVAA